MAENSEIAGEDVSSLVTEMQPSSSVITQTDGGDDVVDNTEDVVDKEAGLVEETCSNCTRKSCSLNACSRCRVAKYCDTVCQRHHWQEHKTECVGHKTRESSSPSTVTQTTTGFSSSVPVTKTTSRSTTSSSESKEFVRDICFQCGKISSNLKSCTRCWNVKYCDRDCQTKHWKQHKLECHENQRSVVCLRDARSLIEKIVLWSEAARLLQGQREMEILPECDDNETLQSCRLLRRKCKKNPDHVGFILPSKLNMSHLPQGWRHPYWLKFFKLNCDYVVKLTVGYTCQKRPDSPLWFGQYKGKYHRRVGSGYYTHSDIKELPCPLRNCSVSNSPHTVLAIDITTAAHVVYDDSEAAKTTVEFFYDNETDRTSIVKLQGVMTSSVLVDHDFCSFTCITHDPGVQKTLKKRLLSKREFIQYPVPSSLPNTRVCIVISHPHGCANHISFGEIKDTIHVGDVNVDVFNRESKIPQLAQKATLNKFQHSCATCPGSSGGPLMVIDPIAGEKTHRYIGAPHSRHSGALNLNESGTGCLATF